MHLRSCHLVTVTGNTCTKVTCSICGEQFLERLHYRIFYCKICLLLCYILKTIYSSWRLAYHKKKVHPQTDLHLNSKCPLCNTGFRNGTVLKQHQIRDHKDGMLKIYE